MVTQTASPGISRRKLTAAIAMSPLLLPLAVHDVTARDTTSTAMSVKETEAALKDYLGALLGGRDVAPFLTDDVVVRFMDMGQDVSGKQAVAEGLTALHGVQFEAQPELVSQIVGEGVVAVEATFIGTHTGEFGGIPPSGKTVRVPYAVLLTFSNGLVAELHLYQLISGLMSQLADTGSPEPSAAVT